jgi:hypothetical protein
MFAYDPGSHSFYVMSADVSAHLATIDQWGDIVAPRDLIATRDVRLSGEIIHSGHNLAIQALTGFTWSRVLIVGRDGFFLREGVQPGPPIHPGGSVTCNLVSGRIKVGAGSFSGSGPTTILDTMVASADSTVLLTPYTVNVGHAGYPVVPTIVSVSPGRFQIDAADSPTIDFEIGFLVINPV